MSEPFLAEVKVFGFSFPPRGWAACDGQILPINQNQSLYSLIGTTYGGDGRTTFALPDLRGRTPIHKGNGHNYGSKTGEEKHTLTVGQMPAHTHTAQCSSDDATTGDPETNVFARATGPLYDDSSALTAIDSSAVSNAGANQGHDNMQPYQVLNFCIALQGLFPSRN